MSKARLDVNDVHYLPVFPYLPGWLKLVKQHLSRYHPSLRERRFWVIAIQMSVISAAHTILETAVHLPLFGLLYFVPSMLFLVPVVYAALSFGLRGALITSLTATVITIPNWILFHESWETLGCMSQLFVVNLTAYFVGQQVNRVKRAQQRAEDVSIALRTSETKYRGLFESSPLAILVLDGSGTILDANPAAGVIFGKSKSAIENKSVAELIGAAGEHKLLGSLQNGRRKVGPIAIKPDNGPELYLEPTLNEVLGSQGNSVIQAIFRDATEEQGRQAGLMAFSAHVIRAQEEERQRIARELHDETIQSLVLLCRRLDTLQSASSSLSPSLVDNLQEARRNAERIVVELRDFTKTLRPPILEDLGIATSIRRLLADFVERTRIKGQLKMIGEERRLPSETELSMFRIAQETLRNIERHAQATRVAVALTFTKEEVRLEVLDNGVGFSKASVLSDFAASGHMGLLSMQERAQLFGGKLEIQSIPGKETRIILFVPSAEDIPKPQGT